MKIEKTRLIVDVSSVLWTNLFQGTDKEFGRKVEFNGKMVQVNSAVHGLEGCMSLIGHAMERFGIVPKDIILCVEGMNAKSLRRQFFPEYKVKSDGDKPPEAYEEFGKLREMFINALLGVGAQAITQDGVEGDDLVAYLCKELPGIKYILSNDGDLAACLVYPGTHIYKGGELDVNGCGPFDPKFITLYKSLVGDDGDSIPGAKGFGDKAWLDTMCIFGDEGLLAFEDIIRKRRIETLAEDVAELKVLQKVIDAKDTVYKCYASAKLYPEKVNTLRNPLTWRVGMVRPRTKATHEVLKPYAGAVKLVDSGNFKEALPWIKTKLAESTEVALDIETATPQESDDWLMALKGVEEDGGDLGVDVLGSKLTGMGLTFGINNQYTCYFTVDHKDSKNLSPADVLAAVRAIPQTIPLLVHNNAFEQPVLKKTWQDDAAWQQNGWQGFLPNVRDTAIMSSYVNENESRGLKKISARVMGYQQETYDEVTQWGLAVKLDTDIGPDGKEVKTREVIGEMWLSELPEGATFELIRRHKMNELTAEHVLSYGADDTICTAAAYNHFRTVMDIEKTWDVFEEVETLPAYLTADAFVKGTPISLERMFELEKEDNKVYDESWGLIRSFLFEQGWEGTVCPVFEELTPATIKEAYKIVTGSELKTMVRTPAKIAKLIEAEGHDLLAALVERNDVTAVNRLVATKFKGEPTFDINSPKQMKSFLYDTLKLPVRIVNKLTAMEREKDKELADAVMTFNRISKGSQDAVLTSEQAELLKKKAKTDDTAIDFALAFDTHVEAVRVALNAFQSMKRVDTRRKMFLRPYRNVKHWTDGRVHANLNQCGTVTRRHSSSAPNLQQLPKRGEGVKFREIFVPHCKDGIVVSVDFAAQELRLQAGLSHDPELLACYVGDNLKDMHAITASAAMVQVWGKEFVRELRERFGQDLSDYVLFLKCLKSDDKGLAKKAKDLRTLSKSVNFGSAYGCTASKLAELLISDLATADRMLTAKLAKFSRYEDWKAEVEQEAKSRGFVCTPLGARRHLQAAILNDDKWIAEKAMRQASNFKIQSAGAELAKAAMSRIWLSGVLQRTNSRFIAPVHDEVVGSVHRDDAVEFIRVFHEAISQPYTKDFPVPFVGSISIGRNFGQQVELGEVFDAEKIQQAVEELFEPVPA